MERSAMSDLEIIAALRDGDQLAQGRAVDALLGSLKKAIGHYVAMNSGTPQDGASLANEAVVVLWEKIRSGTFQLREDTKLSTWCVAVGMNLWLKELRRRKVWGGDNPGGGSGMEAVDTSTPLDIITAVEEHKLVSEDMQRAWRAFKQLSPECQQLFRSDLENKPDEEIMRELTMTNVGSVKVKRHRCKAKWIELYHKEKPGGTPE